MLKKIYLAFGAVLIVGYLGWSLMGWELGGNRRDRVPTARKYSSSSGYGGRSGGYFGGGFGGGFGK